MRLCRNGHPRVPENRTRHDKCAVCAYNRRSALREKNMQAKRAKKERDRTVVNLKLRAGKSLQDDGPLEHARASKIFALMDELERVPSRVEADAIRAAIRALS